MSISTPKASGAQLGPNLGQNLSSNQSSNLGPNRGQIHPLYVRITHWINAIAVFIMIGSGWQIYNASPLFAFAFPPSLTLGGWLAGGLLWHFAGMWLFVANGLFYLALGLKRAHFRSKFLPLRAADVVGDLGSALKGQLSHADLAVYNAVQKLFYLGVLLAGLVIVASGLALWKPVQLMELAALFGGYEGARLVHFFAMSSIVLFLVVHVLMAVLVPRSLRAMIRGR
jgi:thiosulfate reductase cytochrome b subunit